MESTESVELVEYYFEEFSISQSLKVVIDSLHLGQRALQCMALTFSNDGLRPHAYYRAGIKSDTPTPARRHIFKAIANALTEKNRFSTVFCRADLPWNGLL